MRNCGLNDLSGGQYLTQGQPTTKQENQATPQGRSVSSYGPEFTILPIRLFHRVGSKDEHEE
jgi:hypothetical protein